MDNEDSSIIGIKAYNIDNLADDVKAVIENLGRSKCTLVAHDWGGGVGYAFCAKYPEMVSEYITCNIPHPGSIREQQKSSWKQKLMSWYMLFFQCPKIPEIFFRCEDMRIFNGIGKEMNVSNSSDIVEAYKYAFRNPGEFCNAVLLKSKVDFS